MSGGETWAPTLAIEGYEASSLGRVRSVDRMVPCDGAKGAYLRRQRGRILIPTVSRDGYLYVAPNSHTRAVHLLVLEAFHGPRPPGKWGLHDNGDHLDNRQRNLYWGTPSQNLADQVRHGTHALARRSSCPREHLLEAPNLVPSSRWRECRACNRAMSRRRWLLEQKGFVADLRELSDGYYAEIMAGAA